jgi:hypothetical protein
MRLEIEITSNGKKLPVMIVENLNNKQALPVIKQIINGVCGKLKDSD